jgi:hypothetical protein
VSRPGLTWKWAAGEATTLADFGHPETTASYELCVYKNADTVPLLHTAIAAVAGGTCGTRPCWTVTPSRIDYKSRTSRPDGISVLRLAPGADGFASIQLKAKGADLGFGASIDLQPKVVVQLMNTDTGVCGQAEYSTHISKNTDRDFIARSD